MFLLLLQTISVQPSVHREFLRLIFRYILRSTLANEIILSIRCIDDLLLHALVIQCQQLLGMVHQIRSVGIRYRHRQKVSPVMEAGIVLAPACIGIQVCTYSRLCCPVLVIAFLHL